MYQTITRACFEGIAESLGRKTSQGPVYEILIDASVSIAPSDLVTVLHCVAYFGNHRAAMVLLDRGADCDAVTIHVSSRGAVGNQIYTAGLEIPLVMAVRKKHVKVVEVFLQWGASIGDRALSWLSKTTSRKQSFPTVLPLKIEL
ncbi:hypothetical protein WAI453_005556 [Rhynchosporium graminicola]|uniref:Uncharacterized protein n=1 Tax=Rhynchosporium graminicola TaxID=2792576 RepID=A0A1E1LQC2_9HELO|nr:uncharacterized protein RCO7_10923 [Rhynchosporium commune]